MKITNEQFIDGLISGAETLQSESSIIIPFAKSDDFIQNESRRLALIKANKFCDRILEITLSIPEPTEEEREWLDYDYAESVYRAGE